MKDKILCNGCNQLIEQNNKNIFFDNHGYGYSTKLIRCEHCGKINIVKYFIDKDIKN